MPKLKQEEIRYLLRRNEEVKSFFVSGKSVEELSEIFDISIKEVKNIVGIGPNKRHTKISVVDMDDWQIDDLVKRIKEHARNNLTAYEICEKLKLRRKDLIDLSRQFNLKGYRKCCKCQQRIKVPLTSGSFRKYCLKCRKARRREYLARRYKKDSVFREKKIARVKALLAKNKNNNNTL